MPCTPVQNNARGGTGPNRTPYSTRANSAPERRGARANNDNGTCAGRTPTADEQLAADLAVGLVDVFPMGEAGNVDRRGRAWGSRLVSSGAGIGSAAGKIERATTFDRASPGWLRPSEGPWYYGDRSTFTVSFWWMPQSVDPAFSAIFGRRGSGFWDFLMYQLAAAPDRPKWQVFNAAFDTTAEVQADPGEVTLGQWHFVRLWFDATATKIGMRINAGPVHEVSVGFLVAWHSASEVRIGCDIPTGYGFTGRVEQFAVWERLLTDAEAAFVFNGGAGRSYPWPLGCTPPTARDALCSGVPSPFDPDADWVNVVRSVSIRHDDSAQRVHFFIPRIIRRADLGANWWQVFWTARVSMRGSDRNPHTTSEDLRTWLTYYATPVWQSGSDTFSGSWTFSTYFQEFGVGQRDFKGWVITPATRTVQLVETTPRS